MTTILSHHTGVEYMRRLRIASLQRPTYMSDWLEDPLRGLHRIERGAIDLAGGNAEGPPRPRIQFLSGQECNEVLRNATVPARVELEELKARIPFISGADSCCHLLVGNPDGRRRRPSVKSSVLRAELWPGSLWRIADDVYVCSPELLFVQMADILPRPVLVRLGLELCGGYCICPQEAGGIKSAYAVTTPERLAKSIDAAGRVPGVKEARIAGRRIRCNAASPAEVNLFMLLCFPRQEGGYGLPCPELNGEICIALPDGTIRKRFCDFLWDNLAVEYIGDDSHAGIDATLEDANRQGELAMAGIRVVPVTKSHVNNIAKMDGIVASIAEDLGVKKRRKLGAFCERQLELHSTLYPWAH